MDTTSNTNWDTQPHRLDHYRHRWSEVGISTIPLQRNSKRPRCNDWQFRDSSEQWDEAVSQYDRNNIGVRAGRLTTEQDISVVIVDQDDPKTVRNTSAYFDGLGLVPTIVKTASGAGRHAYFIVSGVPEDATYKRLDSKIGAGEVRAGRGAYVVAPCSEIEDSTYHFLKGNCETLLVQPRVQWQDLLQLLPQETTRTRTLSAGQAYTLPVTLQFGDMPDYTQNILQWLSIADKGDSYSNYHSRSEIEMSVICTLILRGWDVSKVRQSFELFKSGHYMDQGTHRGVYLANSYNKAVMFLASTPIRQQLAQLYQDAMNAAWEGRSGNSDRDTLLALIAHCYRHDSLSVFASQRDLAETAAKHHVTISRALKRLQKEEAIVQLKQPDTDNRKAASYGLIGLPITKGVCKVQHKSQVVVVSSKQVNSSQAANNNLVSKFSGIWGMTEGLGPSAKVVYHHLTDQPQSASQLAGLTGKHRSTVTRALSKLQHYGLATPTDKGVILGEEALTEVCLILGAEGLTNRRKAWHKRERQLYKAYLKRTEKSGVKV